MNLAGSSTAGRINVPEGTKRHHQPARRTSQGTAKLAPENFRFRQNRRFRTKSEAFCQISAGFNEAPYLVGMNYTGCRPFDDEETKRLLDACEGRNRARDFALIVMGTHTGFRISELLSLRVSDVWDGIKVAGEVRVAKGFMKGKKKARTMPLHEKVREALLSYLQASRMWHPLFQERPLFPSQGRGTRLSIRQAFEIIVSAAEKAGLDVDRVGTHSLRKTFARRMWVSPIVNRDPAKMARLLGHDNWGNTLRYLEFADELDAAVIA